MDFLIHVSNLRYQYEDGTKALDGVNFHLFPGETVAVLGANGSGKTTFVLHLNGLLAGKGEVRVCGMHLAKDNLAEVRSKVGMVFQDSDEQLFMPSVLEDVAFGPMNLGMNRMEALIKATGVLREVGMEHALDKAPYHLSAGEKKRVALAGVLAMNPEILVLDEPTTYLDPPAQRNLVALLQRLPQAKLIVTHDVNFAAALATRAVFFEKGRLVADGPVAEVIQRYDWNLTVGPAASFVQRSLS
ncbi:MAG TPA: ABC transporter ATP-binding protein [Bryobacteraceae bacterium]|nr:ABC transporter ATP-binding protein [Bryobacteraceae bacterium]